FGKEKDACHVAAAVNAADKYEVKIWQVKPAAEYAIKELHTLKDHPAPISQIAASSDGKLLASTSFDKKARVFETESGKIKHTLEQKGAVLCVAWSPDNSLLATAGEDPDVRLWSADTGKLAGTLAAERGHTSSVTALCFLTKVAVPMQDKALILPGLASTRHDQTLRCC